jgi:hypothetical protein
LHPRTTPSKTLLSSAADRPLIGLIHPGQCHSSVVIPVYDGEVLQEE